MLVRRPVVPVEVNRTNPIPSRLYAGNCSPQRVEFGGLGTNLRPGSSKSLDVLQQPFPVCWQWPTADYFRLVVGGEGLGGFLHHGLSMG